MTSAYSQSLEALRAKAAHELKEIGDQWCTPDNIFWGINAMFGPLVLDLFSDSQNAKCVDYYTAEDNALTQDWSSRLAELNGAAFGNPPYSRASQHDGQYITGMRYIMEHASAMREKGGRYVFLIKAATSEVWWPEDADHIAFIRGRIGFNLPAWFIPADAKQVPSGAFFAGAIAVFDKNWRGPAMSYISRKQLEAQGDAFLMQIRREAERLAQPVQPVNTTTDPEAPAVLQEEATEQELPLTRDDIIANSGFTVWACACAAFGDKSEFTFSESRFAHTWASDSLENPENITVPPDTIAKAVNLFEQKAIQEQITLWLEHYTFEHENIHCDVQERLLSLASEFRKEHNISAWEMLTLLEGVPQTSLHNSRSLRARIRLQMETGKETA